MCACETTLLMMTGPLLRVCDLSWYQYIFEVNYDIVVDKKNYTDTMKDHLHVEAVWLSLIKLSSKPTCTWPLTMSAMPFSLSLSLHLINCAYVIK